MPVILGWNSKGLIPPLRWIAALVAACIFLAGYQRDTLPSTTELRTRLSSLAPSRSGSHSINMAQCVDVIEQQKMHLLKTFSEVLTGVHNVILISLPNHSNKGDSAIYYAQSMLLAFLGIRVHYECGVEQCQYEAIDQVLSRWQHDHFAILFHGGGNIGDLYLGEQDLKINIMERYPHIRMHIFPQSLKFRFDERIEQQRKAFAGLTHPLNSLAVRDVASFEFARAHFNMPNLRIDLTPDIVFFLGFRPDLREQLAPQTPHDLLFFRRKDGEGSEWYFAGGAQDPHFPVPLVERLEAGTGIGGLSPLTGDWIDEDLSDDERDTGHAPSKAWRRFMIGAEYLSRADFVILDRLHGHIVSLILGIPHILIDNNIGKLADYYGTWTHSCKLGRFVPEGGDQGAEVIKVYKEWVDGGKISGRDHRKSARR